mgnify:FL=1
MLFRSGKRLKVIIVPTSEANAEFLREDTQSLRALLYASEVALVKSFESSGPTGTAVGSLGTAYVPLEGVIDIDAERQRLQKQVDELEKHLQSSQKKLQNEQFVTKAPEEVVQRERDRVIELREKLERLRGQMQVLQ